MSSGRRLRYILCASILFCLATAQVSAATAQAIEQVGQLRFQLPEGWQRQGQTGPGGLVQYVPTGANAEDAVLQVYPTEPLDRSARRWFLDAVARQVPDSPGLVQELPYRFSGEKLVEIRTMGLVTQESSSSVQIHLFAGVSDKDQAQLIHYRTRNANYLREHRAMLEQLSSKLEFVDPPPANRQRNLFAGILP